MGLLSALLLHITIGHAEPSVLIRAEVDPSLQFITGVIEFQDTEVHTLSDPLALLPLPKDDRTLFRTYPGRPERGLIKSWKVTENTWRFYTILPKRYGDIGARKRKYLVANGPWHPVANLGKGLGQWQWDVEIKLPEGTTGALGDQVGTGRLKWTGQGERASLAVLSKATVTPIHGPGVEAVLLTRGRPRKAAVRFLRENLSLIHPPGDQFGGTIIELPLRRRLARSGLGQSYLSDRAWRLTPGFKRFHHVGVTRALTAGLLPIPDPFERELAAALLSLRHQSELTNANLSGLLRFFSWNPLIHAILFDRTLPFWGDIFNTAHSADPLQDDFVEFLDPHTRGTVVTQQLLLKYGNGKSWTLGLGLAAGLDLEEAARAADISVEFIKPWRAPYPEQDYQMQVRKQGRELVINRSTTSDAQSEILPIKIDDQTRLWTTGEGNAFTVEILSEPAQKAALDPGSVTRQSSRVNDTWPSKLSFTAAGWVSSINLSQGYVVAIAGTSFRGRYDTKNLFSVSAYANAIDSPGFQVGWLRKFGPLQDGLRRPHRFSIHIDPAFIDPRFHEDFESGTAKRLFTIEGGIGYAWDTRISSVFPLRGHRLSVFASGGFAPSTGQRWALVNASATAIGHVHPRHAFAARVSGGWATGDLTARLLRLGGTGSVAALPPNVALGSHRVLGRAEYRWAAIRNASIPAGFAWLSEVQTSTGLDIGTLNTDEGWIWSAGATLGMNFTMDLLGANPSMMGFSVGIPLPIESLGGLVAEQPQWGIRFGHSL